jgi:alpha-beta hydrolase superfamily lysophospholipase
MTHKDGRFAGARGMSVYFQYWAPQDPAKALILLVHGAGEHSGRYQRVADYFVGHGYAVAALDHPNHGKSDGRYGHVECFDDFVQTLQTFHQQVTADFPGLPQVLFGHSMGGLISCLYLLQQQGDFQGCVLSGPAIKTDIEPGFLQMLLVRTLSRLVPKAGVLALDADGVSRDRAEVEKYVNDPLVNHDKMTARMVAELFRAMHTVQDSAGQLKLPMFLLHGEADPMAAASGSRFLHDAISSDDKTLKIYPGLYHEILNEPERDLVLADILAWTDARVAQA